MDCVCLPEIVIVEFPTCNMGDMIESSCGSSFGSPIPVSELPFTDPSFFTHTNENGEQKLFAVKTLQCSKYVNKVGIGAPFTGLLTAYAGMLTTKVIKAHPDHRPQ